MDTKTTKSFVGSHRNATETVLRILGVLPEPTESRLFVITTSILGVFVVYDLWPLLELVFPRGISPLSLIVIFIAPALSLYHMFSSRVKTKTEIFFMRLFMTLVLSGIALYLGIITLIEGSSGFINFILFYWSILQGTVLLILAKEGYKAFEMTTDQSNKKKLLAAIIVVPSVIIGAWSFDQHWVIALAETLFIWSYVEILLGSFRGSRTIG